jgi:UDP-2,4-diacetamido-2,4,6-trideoxy-beta-L-altropyranose hydrolase
MDNFLLFRCDASKSIGLGHLVRCSTLAAEAIKNGFKCVMLGPPIEFYNEHYKNLYFRWLPLTSEPNDEKEVLIILDIAKSLNTRKLILDSYRVNDLFQIHLFKNKINWLQFDGAGEKKIWANWVVNAIPNVKKSLYKNKIQNHNCNLLLGADYAVVREEFKFQLNSLRQKKLEKILIFAGGGNDYGVLLFLIKSVLSMNKEFNLIVLTTHLNQGLEALKLWVNANATSKVEIHVDPENVSSLMRSCQLAVTSAGTITYELNSIGIPMILFAMADNQIKQAKCWESITNTKYLGNYTTLKKDIVQRAILLEEKSVDKPVSRIVDGLGAKRIINALMKA